MRKFKGGATRDVDDGKIDYRHVSALAKRGYCEYMHRHRRTKLGLREPDNWKKGMGIPVFLKSLRGHFQDLELILEGTKVYERGKRLNFWDALWGIMFNLNGLAHELMKAQFKGKINRLFGDMFEDDTEALKIIKKEYAKDSAANKRRRA